MSSTDRAYRVASVGDNCVDVLGPPVNKRLVGGNAVNVAVQMARLGLAAAYVGAVGEDDDGALTARLLSRNGVNLAGLVRRPGLATSVTRIGFDAEGDRQILEEDFGACDGFACDAATIERLAAMDHVHIGWLNDGGALRRALAARGVSVSQDISVNAAPEDLGVAGLTYVFVSEATDHAAAAHLAARYLADGAACVIVTRGAFGSSAFTAQESHACTPAPITPLDTTGAGDSFIAGFLAARLAGQSLPDALARGSEVAAATCLHPGGFPQP